MGNTPPPKLPVTVNDARWTSSPSGRYSFRKPETSLDSGDLQNMEIADAEIFGMGMPQERARHARPA